MRAHTKTNYTFNWNWTKRSFFSLKQQNAHIESIFIQIGLSLTHRFHFTFNISFCQINKFLRKAHCVVQSAMCSSQIYIVIFGMVRKFSSSLLAIQLGRFAAPNAKRECALHSTTVFEQQKWNFLLFYGRSVL